SRFNESFAVAVEEHGVERWLAMQGDDALRESYAEHRARKQDFLHLLKRHRQALELNYEREASDDDKRRQKAAIFQALRDDYAALKESWGGYSGYDRWFAKPLSNARLSAIATYHDFVPGFRALLEREGDLGKFYAAVGRLAA